MIYNFYKNQLGSDLAQPLQKFQYYMPLCEGCLEEIVTVTSDNQFNKKLGEMLLKENQQNDLQIHLLQSLINFLSTFQISLNQNLKQIMEVIEGQIKKMKLSQKQYLANVDQINNQQQLLLKLQKEYISRYQINQQGRHTIEKLLQDFQLQFKNLNRAFQFLDQIKINVENNFNIGFGYIGHKNFDIFKNLKGINVPEIQKNSHQVKNEFGYQLIDEFKLHSNKLIKALAINKDKSLLLIATGNEIIVQDFYQGIMRNQIQKLSIHTDDVNCLYFMKQSQCFVSASEDSTIIIWGHDEYNKWTANQILNQHKDGITCLQINRKEDLLISGSWDCSIRFWNGKAKNQWISQQILELGSACVLCLSLNETENKLIASVRERQKASGIYIIELQPNKQWKITQKIENNNKLLCFTSNYQFIVQEWSTYHRSLQCYDFHHVKKEFIESTKIPLDYDSTGLNGNLLYVKPQNFIIAFSQYILYAKQNNQYERIQTINYDNLYQSLSYNSIISDDGMLLISFTNNKILTREFGCNIEN